MGLAKKKEQEEKERATEDFITMIDKQLEEMENNKSTNPKQKTEALSAILEKHFSDQEKKENSSETGAIPKTPKDEVSKQENTVECVEKIESPKQIQVSIDKNQVEESVDEILKDSEPKKSKNKKKNKQPLATPLSTEQKNTSPEPEKEKEKTKSKTVEKTAKTAEQIKKEVAEYLNKSRPVKNEEAPSVETK